MPKVSVIIPVYNTEKYLRKCLDSVCNQTLLDIEIICIDDCSTDNSLNILKEYASKDNRIKLIEFKENKGATVARNTGIDEAKGEYIGFIDSDDYIDQNFYENLYKKVEIRHSDIVKGSDMKLVFEDGRIETDEQNFKIKKNKINFWCQYTTAIYKRDFIIKNKIDFPVGLLVGEDPVFTIKAAILADNVEVINNAQYYYVRHEGSLNSDFWDENKIKSYCDFVNIVTDFVLQQNLSDNEYRLFFTWLLNDIYSISLKKKNKFIPSKTNLFIETYNKILKKSTKFPIKLLFDAHILHNISNNLKDKRGIYWVTYNLAKHFVKDPRFDVYFWLEKNYIGNDIKNDTALNSSHIVFSKICLGKGGNFKELDNKNFNLKEYDAYINCSHNSQLCYDVRPTVFNVLHDVMPLLKYDYFSQRHKEFFWKFYSNLNEHTHCFCVSNSCRDGFLRFFDKLDKDKMYVAYNASAQEFIPNKNPEELKKVLNDYNIEYNAKNKYIFYLGAADDARKNLIFNAYCFIKFIEKYDIQDLYFYIGGSGKDTLIRNLKYSLGKSFDKYSKYIVPLGFIKDEDVNILYSNSLFFSFLSLYEGFGMPPLEAMQAGTPVICANNSSLPEVVGDAGILVDAEDEDEIIEAFRIMYFDENKRNEYIQKGLERAKQFSWDKTYKIISDKIIEVLMGR